MRHKQAKDDIVYLADMLTAAKAVMSFVINRTIEVYRSDLLLRSGVERQIEIIGEAARCVSHGTRDAHPRVQWKGIIAQRHVLAHDYGEILDERVWRVATVHIPELVTLLLPLVPREAGGEAEANASS